MIIELNPKINFVDAIDGLATLEDIASEPKVLSASPEEVYKKEGTLAQKILYALGSFDVPDGLYPVIDTRVHRLMPGMYPAIPGWHCDDWPRKDYISQPDPSLVNKEAYHIVCNIATSRHVSNTEFNLDHHKFEWDQKSPLWKELHSSIEKRNDVTRRQLLPGQIVKFSYDTPHRAMPCIERGWRFFFRLSMMHRPPVKSVHNSEQVYILSEENGW